MNTEISLNLSEVETKWLDSIVMFCPKCEKRAEMRRSPNGEELIITGWCAHCKIASEFELHFHGENATNRNCQTDATR
jgi:sarcosine oxidase delta subunit